MKNKKTESIDELIHESLTKEEAEFYDQFEEQNLFQQVGGLFRGKMRWVNMISLIVQLVIIGLAINCIIQFLEANDVKDMMRWGAGMFACMIFSSFIKLQQWLQMETNSVKRELKRLEFQISILANK